MLSGLGWQPRADDHGHGGRHGGAEGGGTRSEDVFALCAMAAAALAAEQATSRTTPTTRSGSYQVWTSAVKCHRRCGGR